MALCASINSAGFVVANTTPVNECTGVLLVSPSEYLMNYHASGVTAEDLSSVLFGSFGFVFTIAAVGFKIKTSKRVVKSI
jgi:hypothetical protein